MDTYIAFLLIKHGESRVPRAWLRRHFAPGQVRNCGLEQHLKKVARGATGRVNPTTRSFQDALRRLERRGLIVRSETHVQVSDRSGLSALAAEYEGRGTDQ